MSTFDAHASVQRRIVPGPARSARRLLGRAIRLPLLGLLGLVEPVVRAVLSLAMVLGILAAVLFELSAAGPRFPFLAMLAASLACGVALVLYYGLIAWLSGRE